jgi:hypothetical protein
VLEGLPAIVLMAPLMFPIAKNLGINDVHYSMVVVTAMNIGLMAPPIGIGFYIACKIGNVSPDEAMGAIWPYLIALIVGLIVIALVPGPLDLGAVKLTTRKTRQSPRRNAHDHFAPHTAPGSAAASAIGTFHIGRANAQAAEFTYKYANNLPVAHPMNARANEAVAKIKEETKGRVDIQIFPNNQLGSDTDMLSQVRSGGVEFFTLSPLILSTLVPTPRSPASASPSRTTTPSGRRWTASSAPMSAARSTRPISSSWTRSGTTASARSPRPRADQLAGRPQGLQDPRAGLAALDLDVHRLPSAPASINFAEVYPRCRPRSSTARRTRWRSSTPPSSTRCRSTL